MSKRRVKSELFDQNLLISNSDITLYIMDPTRVLQSWSYDWSLRRKQCQTHINKWLRELTKLEKMKNQLQFLYECKRSGLIPKGLQISIPSNLRQTRYGSNFLKSGNRRMLF